MLLNLIKLIKKYNMKIKGVIQIGSHYGQENKLYNLINILWINYNNKDW